MTTNASPSCPQCGAPIPEGSADGLCPRCVFAKAMAPTADGGSVPHLPPSLESVRAAFPHLEVTGLIGSGGMGAVFKARQPQLDRFVALKILPTELAGQPGFSERFQREAQALARLSHPHIVTIHDFGQAGGFYFLLMEFIDGVNLRQLLKTKRLTPKEALSIVPPICEALQCAHDHGIVHRDIKPENPLIDKAGSVKIADFGIAKIIAASSAETAGDTTGASSSAATLALGTPDYAAPEQRDASATTDHRADIYSLGVVLYEMLTGERPTSKLEAPSKRVQMDVRIDEIVLRALETKPELRFQTVAEMRTQVGSDHPRSAESRGAGWSFGSTDWPCFCPAEQRSAGLTAPYGHTPHGPVYARLLRPTRRHSSIHAGSHGDAPVRRSCGLACTHADSRRGRLHLGSSGLPAPAGYGCGHVLFGALPGIEWENEWGFENREG